MLFYKNSFISYRSYGIQSQTADEYYDSILHNWPSISLKFYVELNFKCDWSAYFVMVFADVFFCIFSMVLYLL